MRQFRFKYESLLSKRRHVEVMALREIGEFERTRQQLEDELRGMQQVLDGERKEVRAAVQGLVNVSVIRQHAASILQQQRRAEQVVRQLAALHQRIEKARERLTKRTQDRRAIELLKEQHFASWKQREDRHEQNAVDDMNTARHVGEMP